MVSIHHSLLFRKKRKKNENLAKTQTSQKEKHSSQALVSSIILLSEKNNTVIKDFSKKTFDFWALMNDLGVLYDKENKCWYTFHSNEKIDIKYLVF